MPTIEEAVQKWNERPREDMLQTKLTEALETLKFYANSNFYGEDNGQTYRYLAKIALEKIKGEKE